MLLGTKALLRTARSLLRVGGPIYVQFYITARCNLTCKQCNIIYANADVPEATLAQIDQIAENLSQIGTAIVLLTGGEPFVRKDLPEIIAAFTGRGIHVRTQTNGLATYEALCAARESGARDISVSLDSLVPGKQDFLNGSHSGSWQRAVTTIANISRAYPTKDSFAAFGTVLSPQNFLEIPNIIRFATEIGWHVSLVPAHIATPDRVYNFRSYDREMIFPPDLFPELDRILDECITLKKQGYALYDSVEYISNIRTFIKTGKVHWRRRNNDRCDSPKLYFAIRPNGEMQVCCDHILSEYYPVWHKDFPKWYRNKTMFPEVEWHTSRCDGCMYGSYPEISITAHFPEVALERLKIFHSTRNKKPWPLTAEQLNEIADRLNKQYPVNHEAMKARLEALPDQAQATTKKRLPIIGS